MIRWMGRRPPAEMERRTVANSPPGMQLLAREEKKAVDKSD